MNKTFIFISIMITIAILTLISLFIVFKIEEDRKTEMAEDAVAVEFKENLTFEFASRVKLSDCISNINGEIIDDFYIDTTTVGKNTIEFRYKSQRNKLKTKTFNINVIDTVAPEVYISNTMTITVGDNKDLTYSVLSGDNADPKPTRKIQGEYDINKEGNYNLKYVITDASGNTTEKDFTLKVAPKSNNKTTKTTERERVLFSDCISKFKNDNTSIGIDVSKWQGNIDWKKIKDAGVEFVFVRIGYQGKFDGEYIMDKYFEQNIKGATEVGIKVGVYFYSYARTTDDAVNQVDWIYDKIRHYNVSLPVVFDWESWTSFPKAEMSFYDINNVAKTFIKRAEEYGYKGMLYSSKNFLEKIWYVDEFENIWLAHYTDKTNYDGKYQFWQMCDTGRVDGINGAVDIDIWYR